MTPALRLRGIQRRFGDAEVLRGLDLEVAPGEVYALLGRNGAGKTTALRILLGFLEPHAGSAEILGLPSDSLPPDARDRIGYVTEGHRLHSWLKVSDALDLEASTRPRFRRSFAEAALRRCGLPTKQRIRSLSRGQRAQLALTLAVASEPEVLVFDDPALGLDPVMRREFLDAMIDLLSNEGTSVLYSSHILTDVERIADRIGVLHGGVLLLDAALDEAKTRFVKRHWVPDSEGGRALVDGGFTELPELVRWRRRRDGYDLLLLDAGGEVEARLLQSGNLLGPPTGLGLEELFLDLVGDDHGGIFTHAQDAARTAQEVSS